MELKSVIMIKFVVFFVACKMSYDEYVNKAGCCQHFEELYSKSEDNDDVRDYLGLNDVSLEWAN